jgi:hypothetical protein
MVHASGLPSSGVSHLRPLGRLLLLLLLLFFLFLILILILVITAFLILSVLWK